MGSGPSDFHRLGNKRQVRVGVVLPSAEVLRKTKTALFHPLLLQLLALVADNNSSSSSSSSSRLEMVRHLQRGCIVLQEVLIWSLLVATGVEAEEEAVRVNGRTNKCFVCSDCSGIRTECYLALLLSP